MGASLNLALHRLTRHTLVRGGWQHRVFGGEPTFAGVLLEARNAFFSTGSAHHSGIAEFNEHTACRIRGEASGNAHRAHLVERATISTDKRILSGISFSHGTEPTASYGSFDDPLDLVDILCVTHHDLTVEFFGSSPASRFLISPRLNVNQHELFHTGFARNTASFAA